MADSCKGSDSQSIDNRYHKRLSDKDWKPIVLFYSRIFSSHFCERKFIVFVLLVFQYSYDNNNSSSNNNNNNNSKSSKE